MSPVIHSHNVETGEAQVGYAYKGVTVLENINLKHIVPGSEALFKEMDIPYSEELQLKNVAAWAKTIELLIDAGELV